MRILFLIIALLTFRVGYSDEYTRIYLCSRLTPSAQAWNNEITQEFSEEFIFFRPQDIDLSKVSQEQLDQRIYQEDMVGVTGSDLLLVLPPYGRDCAWEIGWFCGNGKPAIAYCESTGEWLKDPMVKGGLTAIITNNPQVYKELLADPLTSAKSYLIPHREAIGPTIKQICTPPEIAIAISGGK